MRTLLAILALVLVAIVGLAQDQTVFQRGDIVRTKSLSPAYPLRVIAVPGDHVRTDKTGIYVNDVAVTGLSPELIEETAVTQPKLIPDKHYYVVGEQRIKKETGEDVSQHWGLFPGTNLEKVQK